MSKNKQSSIEWLAQQLYEQMEMCGDGGVYDKIIKQAKTMHKEEIKKAYNTSFELRLNPYAIAEQYYNETFGGDNNGEITTVNNNIPDTNPNEGNTSTTGNISNTWVGNTWTSTETDSRAMSEKQIWDKTVNWDIINKHTRVDEFIALKNKDLRVSSEEQAPYNVKTNVVTSGKTDDGTIAVIEITIDIKQR